MKKLLSVFVIVMTLGLQAANAQGENWKANDLSLGYGYVTFPQLFLSSTSLISSVLPGIADGVDYKINGINLKSTGSINLEYNRRFTKVFSLGLAVAYESGSAHVDGTGSAFGTTQSGTADISMKALSTMLNLRFFWFNKPHVSMYSKVAGGASFILDMDTKSSASEVKQKFDDALASVSVMPAIQVSPVCIDFGGEAVRGYVELGIGTQGCVLGGVRYRF
ncbi:MAG: hypothetical protein Q4F39_03265 [Bacteroidia bacterium]|nr:hypothetical protein [Bacteroidia bacterium]